NFARQWWYCKRLGRRSRPCCGRTDRWPGAESNDNGISTRSGANPENASGTYRARTLGLGVPARHFVSVATRPHDAWVGRIRQRETGFASAHAALPAGIHHAAIFKRRGNTRAAHVWPVLHVGVDVVRHLVVDGNVIHLPNRELDAMEAAAMHGG